MKLLKQFILGCGVAMFSLTAMWWVFAQNSNTASTVTSTNNDINSPFWNQENPGVNVPHNPWTTLVWGIKKVINYALWLLSLIALVMMLYAWFKMLTAGGDSKKYDEWFTIVKQTGIGLLFIGASWLIVSFIFWIVQMFTSWT